MRRAATALAVLSRRLRVGVPDLSDDREVEPSRPDGTKGARPSVMRFASILCASVVVVLAACSEETSAMPGDGLPPEAIEPPGEGLGMQISMRAMAAPGEEIWKCQVSELPNRSTASVHRVVSRQTAGIHHMDIMVLTLAGVSLEPGVYDCDGLYREHTELMESGVILFASQNADQTVQLPEGVAANLPARLLVMQEIHYVNTTSEPREVASYVNAYTMPTSEVRDQIWGFAIRDTNLTIPAASEHHEWTRCVMSEDIDLLFLASHTHELGANVTVRTFDGQQTGDVIYSNDDWHAPVLKQYETPLHIPAGTGFEFDCHFINPRREPAHWGFAAIEEMCQIAIVFTPGNFGARCDVVATSDGILPPNEQDE